MADSPDDPRDRPPHSHVSWRPAGRVGDGAGQEGQPLDVATRVPRWVREPAVDADRMGEVYAQAISMFGMRPDRGPRRPDEATRGYRLFWGRDPDRIAFLDLPVGGGRYAILGRHHCCDAVLAEDPEVSLRHLLAAAVSLEDGSVALRVLDLRGSMPFFLEDDVPRRSIVASGPVVLRLGRYVIAAAPLDELAAGEPQAQLIGGEAGSARTAAYGTPAIATAASAEADPPRSWLPRTFRTDAAAPPPRSVRPGRVTHVTLMPPAAEIGQPFVPAASFAAEEGRSAGGPVGAAGGRITVERAGRGASIDVSAADLDVGLIIGRADKCTDGGIRAVLNEWVSRAHLLILRQGDEVHAYDLCSMNGTYRDSSTIRHVLLSERGTSLHLGNPGGVSLRWHGAGAPTSQGRRAPISRDAPADSPVP